MVRSLYKALGVSNDATKEEIKKAYKDKAKDYHPDKQGEVDTEKFTEAARAYTILMDDDKRKAYDETGTTGDNVQDTKDVAYAIVQTYFRQFLGFGDGIARINVLAELNKIIAFDMQKTKDKILELTTTQKALIRVKARLKKTSEGDDILATIIEEEEANLSAQVVKSTFQLGVGKMIVELLADYVYVP